MISKLKNIATLSTGYNQASQPYGDSYMLTGRDFDAEGLIITDTERKPHAVLDEKSAKHLLQHEDILYIAKGSSNRACLYTLELGQAFASTLFIVIRTIDSNTISPKYLMWWLNHPKTQTIISRSARGSGIPSVSKKSLGDLEISIPSLKRQEIIVAADECSKREQRLLDERRELTLLINKNRLYEKAQG